MDFLIPDESLAIRARIEVEQEERAALRRSWREQIEDLKAKAAREPKKAAQFKKQIAAIESKSLPGAITFEQIDAGLRKFPFNKWTYAPFPLKLAKGETAASRIPTLDRSIAEVVNEVTAINETRPSLADMRSRAKSFLDDLAANGAPMLSARGDVEMPTMPTPIRVGHNIVSIPDGVALVAWLMRDELGKRIDGMLKDAAPKDAVPTMTTAERRAALKAAESRLNDLHRERAACVELAIASGIAATHRPDAPFTAVLQISSTD